MPDREKLLVIVGTFVIGADGHPAEEPESTRTINQYSRIHRQWLAKHAYWAMHNGREIRTRPA